MISRYNVCMEIALVLIIILLIAYSVFKDYLFYREREKLELKIMSRSVEDYIASIAPEAKNGVEEDEPYISVDDATPEQVMSSKDVQ